MSVVLNINNNKIVVNHYEGFKNKALMTIPTEQDLSFSEILTLLEEADLSQMLFYNVEQDGLEVENGRLTGYSKLVSFNNNMESGLATFNFQKLNEDSEQITELQMALVDLYEQMEGK